MPKLNTFPDYNYLSVRTRNMLHNQLISRVDDLDRYSKSDLLKVPNFGRKSYNELLRFCHNNHIRIADPTPENKRNAAIEMYEALDLLLNSNEDVMTTTIRAKAALAKAKGI